MNPTARRSDVALIAAIPIGATAVDWQALAMRKTDEITKLRAALTRIADEEDIVNYGHTLPKIARDALDGR